MFLIRNTVHILNCLLMLNIGYVCMMMDNADADNLWVPSRIEIWDTFN